MYLILFPNGDFNQKPTIWVSLSGYACFLLILDFDLHPSHCDFCYYCEQFFCFKFHRFWITFVLVKEWRRAKNFYKIVNKHIVNYGYAESVRLDRRCILFDWVFIPKASTNTLSITDMRKVHDTCTQHIQHTFKHTCTQHIQHSFKHTYIQIYTYTHIQHTFKHTCTQHIQHIFKHTYIQIYTYTHIKNKNK